MLIDGSYLPLFMRSQARPAWERGTHLGKSLSGQLSPGCTRSQLGAKLLASDAGVVAGFQADRTRPGRVTHLWPCFPPGLLAEPAWLGCLRTAGAGVRGQASAAARGVRAALLHPSHRLARSPNARSLCVPGTPLGASGTKRDKISAPWRPPTHDTQHTTPARDCPVCGEVSPRGRSVGKGGGPP